MQSNTCFFFVSVWSILIQKFINTWLCKWFFSVCLNRWFNEWVSMSVYLVDRNERFHWWTAFMSADECSRCWICVQFNIWSFNLLTCWLICSALNAVFQTCDFEFSKWNIFLDLLFSDFWIVIVNKVADNNYDDVE